MLRALRTSLAVLLVRSIWVVSTNCCPVAMAGLAVEDVVVDVVVVGVEDVEDCVVEGELSLVDVVDVDVDIDEDEVESEVEVTPEAILVVELLIVAVVEDVSDELVEVPSS